MKKFLVLLIVLLAAACVLGYFTFLKPRPQKKAGTQLQSKAQESPEKKTAQLEEEFRSIQRFAEDNPRDLREIERRVKEFEGKTTPGSFLAINAQRILSDAKSDFDKQAKNASSNIKERAQKSLAKIQSEESSAEGKKKDYTKVIEDIDSFPSDFAGTPYSAELRQLREQVKFYVDACDAWEQYRTDALAAYHNNKDLDRALKILNDFPEKYRTTEWEKERQKLLAEYQGKKNEVVTQQEAEEKLVWHPLFSGESDLRKADWDPQPESAFVVKDGVLTITCPPDQKWVSMSTGDGDWAEFILEFDMRLVRGSILFSVRGTVTSEGDYKFDNIDMATGDLETAGWRKVKLRVKDNKMIMNTPGLRGSKENNCERKSGPVALFVASDSEVQIKSIKIAFYGQEPASWARRQAAKEEKKPEEKKEEKKPEEKKPGEGK